MPDQLVLMQMETSCCFAMIAFRVLHSWQRLLVLHNTPPCAGFATLLQVAANMVLCCIAVGGCGATAVSGSS